MLEFISNENFATEPFLTLSVAIRGHTIWMRTRLESLANSLERSPTLLLGVFFLCYGLSLIMPIQRWLWHDELFTYYIAQAPDMRALLWQSRHLDLNPPMVYIVTRAWQHLFGTNELVARLTSIFAFGLASFGFIVYLKRRVGWLWACAAIALFWASPSFIYASELRPYALVLFFFSMTLLAWDTADSGTHHLPALTALIIGGFGLMLCHVLAVFPLGAIYLGELFRTVQRKSLDWPVWLCLLLPLLLIPTYFVPLKWWKLPAIRQYFKLARGAYSYTPPRRRSDLLNLFSLRHWWRV